ncbi:MAG: peptide deformylase [Candidatus Marinimicrobia bacterium]|nr:peptide deformylase [Candidatus Neomarinimicrobiota bacterium]
MLKIRTYGDPVLREKVPITDSHEVVLPYIMDMIETMYDDDGIGLSANQVGLRERFFVIGMNAFEDGRGDSIFINPEILEFSDELWDYEEGCLSVPGIRELVIRPLTIKVKYFDDKGKEHEEVLTDLAARVFQHEFDHLNGIFFVDRISPIRRRLNKKKLRALAEKHTLKQNLIM